MEPLQTPHDCPEPVLIKGPLAICLHWSNVNSPRFIFICVLSKLLNFGLQHCRSSSQSTEGEGGGKGGKQKREGEENEGAGGWQHGKVSYGKKTRMEKCVLFVGPLVLGKEGGGVPKRKKHFWLCVVQAKVLPLEDDRAHSKL